MVLFTQFFNSLKLCGGQTPNIVIFAWFKASWKIYCCYFIQRRPQAFCPSGVFYANKVMQFLTFGQHAFALSYTSELV